MSIPGGYADRRWDVCSRCGHYNLEHANTARRPCRYVTDRGIDTTTGATDCDCKQYLPPGARGRRGQGGAPAPAPGHSEPYS